MLTLPLRKDLQSILTEGYLFSDKTISVNLSEFESGKKNKLLIAGSSGSGKSTLSAILSRKYRVPILNTDEDFKSGKHIMDTIRNNKRAIIEGIDVVFMYKDPANRKTILSQPMIILGMSALKGGIRAGIRNKKIGMSASEVLRLTNINMKHIESPLKMIRKDIMKLPNADIKEYK